MMPHAAKKGDLEMVKHLIQRGMWVNIGDHYCRTALHRAAQLGHYEIVKYLISCKSELNFKDRAGNTPVLLAGDAGKKDVVDFLLKCGARANCANGDKCTLLHFAAGNGWEDVVSRLLKTQGVDHNAISREGQTPLMWAAREGRKDVAAILLGAGADVNRRDNYWKWTELHFAVNGNHTTVVKELLGERRLDLNPQDRFGQTPLHKAAEGGHYEIVKYLISSKSDLNLKDCAGNTPVLLAAQEQEQEVVDFLLKCGARVNCTNDDKCTLLHFATGNGWTDVVGRLMKYEEIDLNATNQEGESALMWAARDGRKDVIAILLRVGADVLGKRRLDLNLQDRFGRTPLHRACWGHLAVLRQLLEAGADANVKNNLNESALCVGIQEGYLGPEEIRLFVQHGFVFDDLSYARISQNAGLRENVLNNVDLCSQAIVNKFHFQSLPTLKASNFSKRLPCIDKFKLNARQIEDIKNFVRGDIEANTYCNIVKARPMVITVMCIESLVAYLTAGN